MSIVQTHPLVDVIWWTDIDLYVKCPYCEEFHCHGFTSYESALRVPHCGLARPSYQYKFPTTYEIDKPRARFININTLEVLRCYDQNDREDEILLSRGLSGMNLSEGSNEPLQPEVTFDSSTEMTTFQLDGEEPFEQRSILFAISDCVRGKVSDVKDYLEQSSDKSIFLHGQDINGDTCLIMASREKSSLMVSLLLDYGAEVDATNKKGRTALMEASLWGRLETAKILLSRGANRYVHDKRNKRALDLTQPTPQNRMERHTVGGGVWGDPSKEPIYKEDVLNRDTDRLEIARLLRGWRLCARANREPQEPETTYRSFRRSPDGQSVTHYGPIQQYPISTWEKTVAVLERGKPFPSIAAMSGWGHSEWPSTRVSGRYWTEKVLKLATSIGYTLTAKPERDHGIQGQFHASHAEMQLIAYFLDRHVFQQEDKTLNPRFKEEIADQKSQIKEIGSRYSSIGQINKLETEKKELKKELRDKDDRSRENGYDEAMVQQLKSKVASLDEQIARLEKRPEIKEMRARECQIQLCEREEVLHGRLNRMSAKEPEWTLRRATILISSPDHKICDDCLSFKDMVNCSFGLLIELRECTVKNQGC